ncbi:hypothetical protein ACFE04_006119 [Oxalis oulophora]
METLFTILLLFVFPIIFLVLTRRKSSTKRLPPGSLGFPLIGQSLSLLRAMKNSTDKNWFAQRIAKYGPISKLTLFGKPAVFISGPAANKFVFTNTSTFSTQQNKSVRTVMGDRNLLELSGEDHRRVRNALSVFLKPESLKLYVGKMEEEVKNHFKIHWEGKQHVKVFPLMKNLTFNIICSLLCGIERGPQRDQLAEDIGALIKGIWSIPVNLPFTRYNKSLRASARARKMMKVLIEEKKAQLHKGDISSNQDLITSLLSIQNQDGEEDKVLSENEILDNAVILMVAGHETTTILLTFLLRALVTNPDIYTSVLQEQDEIAKNKLYGESLTWEDLSKMKYTWRVATETLRMVPPIYGSFKIALKDIEYEGYTIPKGWKVFWVANQTHMDGNIFPEPTKFDPTRFDNPAATPPFCFVPFGAGPHICPGVEFARIETLVTIHYIVTRFELKLLADSSYSLNPNPEPSNGLPIKITPRKFNRTSHSVSHGYSFHYSIVCDPNNDPPPCEEEKINEKLPPGSLGFPLIGQSLSLSLILKALKNNTDRAWLEERIAKYGPISSQVCLNETLTLVHYIMTRFEWKLLADSSYYMDPTPAPHKGPPAVNIPIFSAGFGIEFEVEIPVIRLFRAA